MGTDRTSYRWCVLFACLLMVALGCGPDLGQPAAVSGKVTVDGQPLSGATVALHCTAQRPAEYRTFHTTTDSQGVYSIPKVYPGLYTVAVVEPAADAGAPEGNAEMQSAHPEDSLRPMAGGELQLDVKSPAITFDVQLTRPKNKIRTR